MSGKSEVIHCMIDFETLDTRPTSVVLSCGAVLFSKSRGVFDELIVNFDIDSQLAQGRTVSASTLAWWVKQSSNAKDVFSAVNKEKTEILWTYFDRMFRAIPKENGVCKHLKVWANGTDFDISMIDNIFESHGQKTPWHFWNVTDYRTFGYLTGFKKPAPKGSAHNALVDAKHQAECVLKFFNRKKG